MQEKKSYIFTKLLLVAVAIFIGLSLYTYKMIKEEKENNHKNSTVVILNTPIPHPPLSQRDEKKDTPVNLDLNSSLENNKTKNIPEGAEYISLDEQLETEANLSDIPKEEIYDDSQIIPQDEINNYEEAITIPMPKNDIIPQQAPISTNPFNNPSLGTPIRTQNNQRNQQHPTLGTPIGDSPISPF